jgi:hypothetical protein
MSITIPLSDEQTRKVSDGYHTFEELYDHRVLLFLKLVFHAPYPSAWKPHYPGWPVLFLETPVGQISYHFPEKFLSLVEANIQRDDNYKWDGHTPGDVLKLLEKPWK